MSDDLTEKQKAFCREYLIDLNGTRAAVAAGYSENTASEMAYENLRKPQLSEFIQALMAERSKRTEITADVVLRELLLLAKTDVSRAYDENGNLLNIKDIPEDVRRAVSGVKVYEEFEGAGRDRVKIGEVRELKLWDKNRALELLGRHLKLFTDKIEHSGKVTFESKSDEELDQRIRELAKHEPDLLDMTKIGGK